jgi:hypothetical protein
LLFPPRLAPAVPQFPLKIGNRSCRLTAKRLEAAANPLAGLGAFIWGEENCRAGSDRGRKCSQRPKSTPIRLLLLLPGHELLCFDSDYLIYQP